MDQVESHSQEAVTGPNQDANNVSPDGYQDCYGPASITCLLLPLSLMDGNVHCSYPITTLPLSIEFEEILNI